MDSCNFFFFEYNLFIYIYDKEQRLIIVNFYKRKSVYSIKFFLIIFTHTIQFFAKNNYLSNEQTDR